jgi:putative ABC transport system permease protein
MDPNYIPLYGLTLVAGRNMFPGDSSGAYIINETAAKALGFHHPADAIGRTLTCGYGGQPGPVVGVLKDFHSGSYHEEIKPFFFLPARGRGGLLSVKLTAAIRTARQAKLILDRIEKLFRSVDPQANFSARFFDAAIAIVISCMGLFGLAAYTASQRTKEIGIRKILGASVPQLMSMLSRNFVILVLLSTLIAAPVAGWAMHKWLGDFAYRVSIPWWIYLVAGTSAVLIALLTVSFQAIRAATANPVESLRSE